MVASANNVFYWADVSRDMHHVSLKDVTKHSNWMSDKLPRDDARIITEYTHQITYGLADRQTA